MRFNYRKNLYTLILTIGATIVFGLSYGFFYNLEQKRLQKEGQEIAQTKAFIESNEVIGTALPSAHLIDISGNLLDNSILKGKRVILVFVMPECRACDDEATFLSSVIGAHKKIEWIGVLPFGEKGQTLKEAQGKYPFRVFYDENGLLSRSLEIDRVPIKVFVDGGLIRKVWIGSTGSEELKTEFDTWLVGLDK